MSPLRRLAALAAGLLASASAGAAAAQAPPPPTAKQIQACVKQVDPDNRWTFGWKKLEIGQPRHPRNSYESFGFLGGGAPPEQAYGYPVHVVYDFNGIEMVDAIYWFTPTAGGGWQIPFICRAR